MSWNNIRGVIFDITNTYKCIYNVNADDLALRKIYIVGLRDFFRNNIITTSLDKVVGGVIMNFTYYNNKQMELSNNKNTNFPSNLK